MINQEYNKNTTNIHALEIAITIKRKKLDEINQVYEAFNNMKHCIEQIIQKDNPLIDFINNHSDIFYDIWKQKLISDIKENINNHEKLNSIYEKLINDILQLINTKVNYEKVIDKDLNTVFYEWLLRVKSDYNFNHIDLLELAKLTWKTIQIFYKMFENITNDIKNNKIQGTISINAEVSDILNPNFIPKIKELINKNNIDLNKQKIIIEILENQKIPNTKKFYKQIILLKEMWFLIAFDDIFSEKVWLKETIKNLKILNYNIDIIKIDWKKIHDLYNVYKAFPNSKIIEKCSNTIKLAQEKWIKVVAEWIETEDMFNFSKDILWANLFQGFLFKK